MSEQRPKSSKQGTIVILLVIVGILVFGSFNKYAAKLEAERLKKEQQTQQETARLQKEQAERDAKAKAEVEAKAQAEKEEKERVEAEAKAKEEAQIKTEEEKYWELLDKTRPEELKAYIAKYPSGTYADLAQAKVKNLEAAKPGETANATNNSNPGSSTTGAAKPELAVDRRMTGEFVRIPAGTFTMGSNNGEDNEKPVHDVVISRSFEIGKYEVTQEQWELVIGNNPSKITGDKRLPVQYVSWEDIQQFIRALNNRDSNYIYRLPTEAEWEYACRAGTTGDYAGNLDALAWYGNGRYRVQYGSNTLHPVGEKQPNAWGLYDMHGNVKEWCSDWYGDYPSELVMDPQGAKTGSGRVVRGGNFNHSSYICRSAFRGVASPDYRDRYKGFRLVRTQKGL